MEDNNFDINLADMNDAFDNKTFRYRINGFAYACGMKDVVVNKDSGVVFNTNGFDNLHSDNDQGYFISVNKNEYPIGKTITLSGKYNDLNFTFINYYNKEKLDTKIRDLPFSIVLIKPIEMDTYRMEIETINGMQTKFAIYKYQEFKDRTLIDDVVFYANVMDFSKILKLVKSFVYNPKLVFNVYSDLEEKHRHIYTNTDLDKAILQDKKLDKPMSKIKKIVQRLVNND